METITVKELYELKQKDEPMYILDVRSPKEFAAVHMIGAQLHPIDEFDPNSFLEKLDGNPKIYVACATSVRSARVCKMLLKTNYDDVVLIEGGTVAWEEAGYPVERSTSGMPLQQQIKIFQGATVLLGSVFGWLFSSAFLLLPMLIGGEMIYAARTGNSIWSGLFARMPWNL